MAKFNLTKTVYSVEKFIKRNSPTILSGLAAVGVISTAVLSGKATLKAHEKLQKARKDNQEELSAVEIIRTVAPEYIPVVLSICAAVTCIFGANTINKRRQASLTSAYCLLDNYFKEYRGKLIELHGEEADREIRDAIIRNRCDYHQIDSDVPDDKLLFYEEISGETVARYERDVIDAEYHFNRNLVLRGYASLNEFYEFLGLPQTEYGEAVGWSMAGGYGWVDFQHRQINRDDGGTPIYAIDMIFPPDATYLEGWEY